MKMRAGRYTKTLLLITYYWPPLGGPGSLRPVKFAKYLPDFDIKPIILTRKDIAYHSYDRELQEDVRNIQVLRTDSMDPARLLRVLGMKDYYVSHWHVPIKRTINFPDNKTLWMPFAYDAARNIDFDYIFVTAPPFSAFITGYYLAKSTGKPLIIDFRDAWLEFPFMPYEGFLQRRFVQDWERKVVGMATLIVVVDENIRSSLLKRYPQISRKICLIPNGYDPDDFVRSTEPDKFTISYLGTIRAERNPEYVLKAVSRFVAEKGISDKTIRLRFIGHVEEHFSKEMKSYPFVELTGHLSYRKAINTFCNSHLAVLISTGSEYFFPSRQNEYLASGLPVIVCGRSKGLHMLTDAFQQGYPGWTFDFDDVEGMKRRIHGIYKKYREGITIRGEIPYQTYTRRNLARILAERIRAA